MRFLVDELPTRPEECWVCGDGSVCGFTREPCTLIAGGQCGKLMAAEKARKRFVKPTVEEVRRYCMERRNTVDAQSFIDHYDSNGWLVGKVPMKDWKAAVRTWERTRTSAPQRRANEPRFFED